MKQLQKLTCLLLALLLVFSLGVTAFAAEGDPDPDPARAATEKGSVTINGALNGNNFTLYKIFDLDSYVAADNHYVYTIANNSPLYDTVKNMTLKAGNPVEDKPVFALTSKDATTDYVQLTVFFSNSQDDGAEVKAIASKLMAAIDGLTDDQKAALSMRQVKKLGITGETKLPDANKADIVTEAATGEGNENKSNIKFSNLDLGYYLIDSTAGAMLGLTTTNPNATITAKNKLPNVVKDVKRNVDDTWSDNNTKIIGETVNYRVQVGVQDGAENYVIYDSMSEGLTYQKITKVYYGYNNNPDPAHVIYDAAAGTAITDPALADYFEYTESTAAAPITHGGKNCCFKMKFADSFLQTVLNGSGNGYTPTIYVEYDAVLNEKAVIGATGNPNDVYLTYGENEVDVSHDTVTTYTYEMELVKTKEDNTVLEGAEFEVYTQRTLTSTAATALDATETLSGKLSFIETKETIDGKEKTVYTVATQEQIDDANTTTVTTIKAGDVIIRGLGGNFATSTGSSGRKYYFKETKAPDGYTEIPTSTEFTIVDANQTAVFEAGKWKEGGLRIVNKSGTLLPSTGGIGTTIFYVVGSVLLVGAGVLLVTKRRMSSAK